MTDAIEHKPTTVNHKEKYRAASWQTNMSRLEFNRWYVWTGEKRKPRKGEFFLSGSIVEVYKTDADLETVYHIAQPVGDEVVVCPHCRQEVKR